MILGTRNCGRRAALCDLVSRGLGGEARAGVLLSENESASEFDSALAELADVKKYSSFESAMSFSRELEGGVDTVFYVADASKNLADEIENFKAICDAGVFRLVRILGFFDCELFSSAFDECAPFYDAMSHFCDAVILSNRGGVSGKAVSDIKKRYIQKCQPHIFQLEKKNGELENHCMLLIDEPRRISMVFDDFDPVDELELDEDTLPDEPFSIERKPDHYLERLENGARRSPIICGDELISKFKNAK